ncbi:MAG: PIN domain-containing protein [Acidimicrobiales bacterium]|jgi:predicted nucleic acid-binding protein|nr:PIN domain-containing protein [Acidimicrobiales bacterium]MDP6895335.1 PIN domain-containing protein [Acidimicrobiales bacterium]HJM37451.1 PIN domain-containing protein [Acidimicrobiales bacterium]|tara:strand:- start:113 stop:559 length:447 start_codon:yes stop_codon:yes gene_type:complete
MLNRVFIDASVLVKLFDDNAPIEQAASRNLIGDVENTTLVTSALSMADFYEEVTTEFSRKLEMVTAKQALNDLTELTIVQIDSDLVLAATETQSDLNIEMREAIAIEAAVTSGCDFIVSEVIDKEHTVKGILIRSLEEMMNNKENKGD